MLADAPYVCVYNYNVRNTQTMQLYTYCNSLQCSLVLHKTAYMFAADMQCMYMPHYALHVCLYTYMYVVRQACPDMHHGIMQTTDMYATD